MSNKLKDNYKVGRLIYDANIYDGMNTYMGDLDFYMRWLPKRKNARILELCCGTGRLTIPIAKAGYNICGVDFTPSMLQQARAKASAEGLEITFIEADIRSLDLPETYDLIFIPFNSIHHLYKNEDLFMALKKVKQHLKAGGHFLMDCFNPNIQFIVDGGHTLKEISKYSTKDGRKIMIKEIMNYENTTQINRIEWHYFIDGEFASVQNLDMRMFYPQELDTYIKSKGFNIIHKFGSFKEDTFDNTSDKQIYICQ